MGTSPAEGAGVWYLGGRREPLMWRYYHKLGKLPVGEGDDGGFVIDAIPAERYGDVMSGWHGSIGEGTYLERWGSKGS